MNSWTKYVAKKQNNCTAENNSEIASQLFINAATSRLAEMANSQFNKLERIRFNVFSLAADVKNGFITPEYAEREFQRLISK